MSPSRVWRFGDDINTDLIISGKYLDNYSPTHLAAHALEGACPGFSKDVCKGDIIIAGRNFGCGSSREQAVVAIKHCGVSAIVARSFARIFYRNAVNLGLVVVVSPDAGEVFRDGDLATLDAGSHRLVSATDGRVAVLEPIPGHVKRILDEGGLVPYVAKRLRK